MKHITTRPVGYIGPVKNIKIIIFKIINCEMLSSKYSLKTWIIIYGIIRLNSIRKF